MRFEKVKFDIYLKFHFFMQIKNHQLYSTYLCYLDSKKLPTGSKSLAQISESMFYEFLKRYEFSPGFKEKWDKKLLENKRDENIQSILEKEPYTTFFETLDESVFIEYERNNNIDNILKDDFEIFFEEESIRSSKNKANVDDDIFDF